MSCKSTGTTSRYAHLSWERLREAGDVVIEVVAVLDAGMNVPLVGI